jgi:MFS family permease
MSIELMKQYSISISQIGLISSLYFLTYTLSQIPVGYLMKIHSPRNLIGTACLSCAVMALCFSLSPTYITALVSLLFYAFFGSFGFVGALTYATKNIPKYSSILVGATQSLAMAAGCIASNMIPLFLKFMSWQEVTQISASGLAILGVIIFICVPNVPPTEDKTEAPQASLSLPLSSDKTDSIYCSFQTWTNAMYAGFIYFPLMVFTEGGLGPSLLQSIHNHSRAEISFCISIIFIGWMIGGPIAGVLSNHYGRTRIMRYSAIMGLIFAGCTLFVKMPMLLLSPCLFLFGITNTGIIGSYSISTEMHGPKNASVSLAITNMATILIGSILGGLLPFILEMTSTPIFLEGIPTYSASDYQRVFGTAILIAPVIAYICGYLTKDPATNA